MLGEFRRDLARLRLAVIAANPELRERELAKLADYATSIAGALRARGVPEPQATLAAQAGTAVLQVALERWVARSDDAGLTEIVHEVVSELRTVAAGS